MATNETRERRSNSGDVLSLTYELFIFFLSIYAIAALVLVLVFQPRYTTIEILIIADDFVAVIFIYDFIRQLYRASNKLDYMKWGWMDLLSAIPGFYYLRILRLGRIVRISRELRRTTGRTVWENYKHYRAESALLTTIFLLFFLVIFTSIFILRAEEGAAEATILSSGDAVWWSFVTLATVGYGDTVPVTAAGRVIGFVLMAGGITLLSIFTGYAASYFRPGSSEESVTLEDLQGELAEIKQLLAEALEDKA